MAKQQVTAGARKTARNCLQPKLPWVVAGGLMLPALLAGCGWGTLSGKGFKPTVVHDSRRTGSVSAAVVAAPHGIGVAMTYQVAVTAKALGLDTTTTQIPGSVYEFDLTYNGQTAQYVSGGLPTGEQLNGLTQADLANFQTLAGVSVAGSVAYQDPTTNQTTTLPFTTATPTVSGDSTTGYTILWSIAVTAAPESVTSVSGNVDSSVTTVAGSMVPNVTNVAGSVTVTLTLSQYTCNANIDAAADANGNVTFTLSAAASGGTACNGVSADLEGVPGPDASLQLTLANPTATITAAAIPDSSNASVTAAILDAGGNAVQTGAFTIVKLPGQTGSAGWGAAPASGAGVLGGVNGTGGGDAADQGAGSSAATGFYSSAADTLALAMSFADAVTPITTAQLCSSTLISTDSNGPTPAQATASASAGLGLADVAQDPCAPLNDATKTTGDAGACQVTLWNGVQVSYPIQDQVGIATNTVTDFSGSGSVLKMSVTSKISAGFDAGPLQADLSLNAGVGSEESHEMASTTAIHLSLLTAKVPNATCFQIFYGADYGAKTASTNLYTKSVGVSGSVKFPVFEVDVGGDVEVGTESQDTQTFGKDQTTSVVGNSGWVPYTGNAPSTGLVNGTLANLLKTNAALASIVEDLASKYASPLKRKPIATGNAFGCHMRVQGNGWGTNNCLKQHEYWVGMADYIDQFGQGRNVQNYWAQYCASPFRKNTPGDTTPGTAPQLFQDEYLTTWNEVRNGHQDTNCAVSAPGCTGDGLGDACFTGWIQDNDGPNPLQ